MFKFGDIVYIKVNGTCGFVEGYDTDKKVYPVSIPLKDADIENEIYSSTFEFYEEELETAEDRIKRELSLQILEFELKEEWQKSRREKISAQALDTSIPEGPVQ